jgi:hypothetical protein
LAPGNRGGRRSKAGLKSADKDDRWTLRPGDLPTVAAPHLADLENNAVYRHLIHHHRSHRRQRLTLIVVYLGIWLVVGALYGHFILGADLGVSLSRTTSLLIVLSIGIMNIYILAGIEGYETNGWLKGRFFDLIESGMPAREIAQGIIGKTVSHYPLRAIYPALIAGPLALLVSMLGLPFGPATLMYIWFLMLGVFGAFVLLGALPSLGYLTIPGTLLWYHGVRRSYERRLAELRGRPPSMVMAFLRTVVFLAVSVSSAVVPLLGFLFVGAYLNVHLAHTWYRPDEQLMLVCGGFGLFAMAGLLCGVILGMLSRRLGPFFLGKLEREIDRLFRIRGDVLFGG